MLTRMFWQLGLIAAGAMIGCAAPIDVASNPHEATADSYNLEAGPWGYFRVSTTLVGECAPAVCGDDVDRGMFIQALNLDETACADGTTAPECFVRDIAFSDPETHEATLEHFRAIFRKGYGVAEGWIGMAETENGLEPRLFVNQAWSGAVAEQIKTPVFNVAPAALMCIRAPCPTHYAGVANTENMLLIEGVDLFATGAAERIVTLGYNELATHGILVAGEIVEQGGEVEYIHQPLPGSHVLTAQNFFTMLLE